VSVASLSPSAASRWVCIFVATFVAFSESQVRAEMTNAPRSEQRQVAANDLERSVSLLLSALSRASLSHGEPEKALAYAVVATTLRSSQQGWPEPAVAALQTSVAQHRGGYTRQAHAEPIKTLLFSPTGKHLVTISSDDSAILWDTASGAKVATLLTSGASSKPDILDCSIVRENIMRHLLAEGQSLDRTGWESMLRGDRRSQLFGIFQPFGRDRLFGAAGRRPRSESEILCQGRETALRKSFDLTENEISSRFAFSPNGESIAVANGANADIWLTGDGALASTLNGTSSRIVHLLHTDRYLSALLENGDVVVWNIPDKKLHAKLSRSSQIKALAANGERLFGLGSDGTLNVWSLPNGQHISVPGPSEAGSNLLISSADGSRGASFGGFDPAALWNLSDLAFTSMLPVENALIEDSPQGLAFGQGTKAAIFAGATRLVSVGNDGGIHLWNAESGRHIRQLAIGLNFGPIVTSAGVFGLVRGFLHRWSLIDGRDNLDSVTSLEKVPVAARTGRATSLAIDAKGEKVAFASDDGSVQVWRIGQKPSDIIGRVPQRPDHFAMCPQARYIVAVVGGSFYVWAVESPLKIKEVDGVSSSIEIIAPYPNEDKFLTASKDGGGLIWNAQDLSIMASFQGYQNPIERVHINKTGERVILEYAGYDPQLRNGTTGALIGNLNHKTRVRAVSFDTDGHRIATGSDSEDGELTVWDARTGEVVRKLKANAHVYSL
jgi:WD40 repeat protein